MKVEGKDIFTIESVTAKDKKLKPGIQEIIDQILDLMEKTTITKIEK